MEMFHEDMALLLLHNNEGVDVTVVAPSSSVRADHDGIAYNTTSSTPIVNNGHHPLKKGPWTAAEDAILTEYVRKHGEGNWNALMRNSRLARCGKSCRLRWANHLRPNLKKGPFSNEEERLIVQLHAKYGNKWARMASRLPGRTDNEIKNYWNTRIKRRQRQGLPLYPSDVQLEHSQAQELQLHSQKNHIQILQQQCQQQQHLQQCHPYLPHSQSSNPFPFQDAQFLTGSPQNGTPPQTPSSVPATPLAYSPNQKISTLPLLDPFSIPLNPPLLSSSFRFRNHCFDTLATTDHHQMATPITAFSVPSSPISAYAAILPLPENSCSSQSQFYRLPSFQFNSAPMMNGILPDSVKFELPSNQFCWQNNNSDLTFDTSKVNISGSSSGLLNDLLEEAHALSNGGDSFDQEEEQQQQQLCLDLKEENLMFNGSDDRNIGLV